jgi:hypothetical protein
MVQHFLQKTKIEQHEHHNKTGWIQVPGLLLMLKVQC